MENIQFYRISCGDYGRSSRKRVEFAKNNDFPKMTVGIMGAMDGMPKTPIKVEFGEIEVFQNWLWALWAL